MKKLQLICAVLICLSLSACSLSPGSPSDYPSGVELPPLLEAQGEAGDGGAQNETNADFPGLADLQTYRFDGRAFTVAVYEGCEFFPRGGTDPYSLALSERNEAVQKKTGVVLTEYLNLTAESFYSDLRIAYQGGTLNCDALVMPVHVMSLFAVNGLLQNIYSVPFLDMNAEYTHKDEMAAFTVGTKGFGYFSDALENTPFLRCLFVNERGVVNADALYASALAGEFDFDAFFSAAKASSLSAGLVCDGDREELALDLFCATGQNMFDNAPPKRPAVIELFEKLTAFSSRFADLTSSIHVAYPSEDEAALDIFLEGDSAFYLGTLTDAALLSRSDLKWGILPLPNEAGDSGYHARMTDERVCISVMKNADYSYSGKIINTIAAASSRIGAARRTSAVYAYLPSETSAAIFGLLSDAVYSDLGIDYGGIYAILAAGSREVLVNYTVHGMEYESLYKNACKSLERFLRDYTFYE